MYEGSDLDCMYSIKSNSFLRLFPNPHLIDTTTSTLCYSNSGAWIWPLIEYYIPLFGIFTWNMSPYPMRRSRITIIFYCRYWNVPIKLALEKPLTNCDTFPDNNDPNVLFAFFKFISSTEMRCKPYCHFCLLADDKFDYLQKN